MRLLRPCVAVLFCLLWAGTAVTHANGRMPGATGLAINPADERQLLLGLTYGLALTRDSGASWTWMCEEQIEGNGGDVDPAIAMTSDGSLVVLSLTNGGVLVSSDDGCSFQRAQGLLKGHRGVDLTLDHSQPGHVLVLMSTIVDAVDGRPVYESFLAHSLDHGRSWQRLAELPSDMAPETVEVAGSDANRIYVSGTGSLDPLQGIVERSDDGGRSWKRTTVRLPRGSGSLFLSGIHPRDPDRLWFRVPGRGDIYGALPAKLWLSTDGATSFVPVSATEGGMLGFALSPDGDRLAFGGPADGLFVAPADASAAPSKVSDVRVNCLRWSANGLYVCAGEPLDPYSLGYAAEPTLGFVPVWRRANTCRAACAAEAPLERTCRGPWEAIAPLVSAETAVCDDGSSVPSVVADAAVADGGSGPRVDASSPRAQPATADHAASASGCSASLSDRDSTLWWLLLVGCVCRRRRARL
jgi:photosystem II stability/assembly factor-like uncharacterized protein